MRGALLTANDHSEIRYPTGGNVFKHLIQFFQRFLFLFFRECGRKFDLAAVSYA
jgi:hypothetical protein